MARAKRLFFDRPCALTFALLVLLAIVSLAAGDALYPEAGGSDVASKAGATVDFTNASQGYIMVKHKPSKKRVRMRVTLGEEVMTYDLKADDEYEVIPLQMGSGSYIIRFYQQVSGSQYSNTAAFKKKVSLEDEKLCFLYPNQYVWYEADDQAVKAADELCAGLEKDVDKVEAVYNYITSHFVYDYILAVTVKEQVGYLPDLEKVWEAQMGICFDLASTMACMLRSQGVPTQLVIGYADDAYHAWNNVWIGDGWHRYDPTAKITANNVKAYTQERCY